ncbi:hypothetical protein GGQ61_004157 [Phenylobacterium haematophilum]|uniref:CopG family transcriptional regulator n=1 Tax=Phenylobacterium haematophilum TaxID=98513 RepID=A0A840A6Z8_9CAUL|nr:hypothetical protein [Phenylobacterium haematophilum]MBB3893413.1 hypothetical protein [Phenylobacterium haematophilum]
MKAEPRTARVQVYLTDPKLVSALNREARQCRLPLSQAAGRAIARGLLRTSQPDADDRLLHLDRSLRDHMRSTARDVQIIQELVVELARAFFLRLPDAVIDNDPTVQAAVERRIELLLHATASRIASGRAVRHQDDAPVHPSAR